MSNYTFGDTLTYYRKLRGFTQEELALRLSEIDDTKINKGMVSKWENNKEQPTLNNAQKLSTVLGVTLDTLLGLDGTGHDIKNDGALLISSYVEKLTDAEKNDVVNYIEWMLNKRTKK